MRIVLAIGDANLRLALDLMLSEEPGAEIVATASNSEGMIALVKTLQPEVLMLDWELPGKPIHELLLEITQQPIQPKILVFGKRAALKETAISAGAHAFINKGEPPEKLLAAYRRLCVNLEDQPKSEHISKPIEEKGKTT
jgi:two-component system response regulator DesR